LEDLTITQHALERFIERQKKLGQKMKDPEACIMKLLKQAEPEQIDNAHKIKRIIKHGFREAEYLVTCGWRFVVVEGSIVTIERTKKSQC